MKTFKTTMFAMIATIAMMMSNGTAQASESAAIAPMAITSTTIAAPAIGSTLSYIRTNEKNIEHRFDYILDAEGRVVSKMMSGWDAVNNCWKPQTLYRASYGTDTNRLTFATYDEQTGAFTGHVIVTDYDASQNQILLNVPAIPSNK